MSGVSIARLSICAAALAVLCVGPVAAAPAYVPSSVNLRSGAGTDSDIVTKIPGGSLVEVLNCAEGWCELEWQENKGFVMEASVDRSGRIGGAPRKARRRVAGSAFGLPFMGAPFFQPYRPYRYRHGHRRYWASRHWHW